MKKTRSLLSISKVSTRLSAQDLERARAFYAEKFGLEPIEDRPGGLRYLCGDNYFSLFESNGVASGTHTQMAWEVTDIEAVVTELRHRSIVFENVDVPGLRTVESPRDDNWQPFAGSSNSQDRRRHANFEQFEIDALTGNFVRSFYDKNCRETEETTCKH